MFVCAVYCETCIFSPDDRAPRCHVCQSAHPNGYPKVCLVLKHFLEEQLSEQYALRKEVVGKQADSQNGSGPTCTFPTAALCFILVDLMNLIWISTFGCSTYYP